ncbi:MAG: glycerophosphodiester phosphodiesterase [Ignavibacteria bacterium]|nr:glycerophosphodiester phosphodiesterase [Ignavibacteria bacterium]
MSENKKKKSEFRIFAHRGASGRMPENTLPAIEKAISYGAKWIEIDIQFSDGEIFVFHDERLERLTDGEGFFKEKSIEYLRSLNAGNGGKIPYLREVLEISKKKLCINIEIKDDDAVIPLNDELKKQIDAGKFLPENFIISSYFIKHIELFRSLNSIMPCAIITDYADKSIIYKSETLDCRSVHINISGVNRNFVEVCHSKNVKVYVFTVDTEKELNEMKEMNVDGIFTDFPDLFILS